MSERRKHERYTIALPARLEVVTAGGKQILEILTKNVCAGGTLLDTDRIFPIGAQARVNIAVRSERWIEMAGAQTLIKVEGRVLRSGPTGTAVHFNKDYKILKL
jgi:hypothetical protein